MSNIYTSTQPHLWHECRYKTLIPTLGFGKSPALATLLEGCLGQLGRLSWCAGFLRGQGVRFQNNLLLQQRQAWV